jgi:hypothetical protein
LGNSLAERVGVGVAARGGLDRLDVGDVARDTILDPGREAEKNFLEDPNDLELLNVLRRETSFPEGET